MSGNEIAAIAGAVMMAIAGGIGLGTRVANLAGVRRRRRAIAMLAAESAAAFDARDRYYRLEREDPIAWLAAEDKAFALLKSWLSPEQLEQYERAYQFDVTGSDTGKRYRIRHGRMQNVYELDAEGNAISGLCFWPGPLPTGDCMLAQKIALETRENEALAAANRFGVLQGPATYDSG